MKTKPYKPSIDDRVVWCEYGLRENDGAIFVEFSDNGVEPVEKKQLPSQRIADLFWEIQNKEGDDINFILNKVQAVI